VLEGRSFCAPDDVKAVAVSVLAHRLGAAAGRDTDTTRDVVAELLGRVTVPLA
jgi:MoxR-like ATPase